MRYPVAEKFVAPQGEGLHTGAVMAFVRLVGCSVGQKVCTTCDTDFDRVLPDLGGGLFTVDEIAAWVSESRVRHVCLTGGEPLDRDLRPLLLALEGVAQVHVETSGTKHPAWLDPSPRNSQPRGVHAIGVDIGSPLGLAWRWMDLWVTVSPKPGYREDFVARSADEVKVILGGLGDGPGWPTVEDAVRWADAGKLTYVQPRNERLDINHANMREAIGVVTENPGLRLSAQLHKYIRTR